MSVLTAPSAERLTDHPPVTGDEGILVAKAFELTRGYQLGALSATDAVLLARNVASHRPPNGSLFACKLSERSLVVVSREVIDPDTGTPKIEDVQLDTNEVVGYRALADQVCFSDALPPKVRLPGTNGEADKGSDEPTYAELYLVDTSGNRPLEQPRALVTRQELLPEPGYAAHVETIDTSRIVADPTSKNFTPFVDPAALVDDAPRNEYTAMQAAAAERAQQALLAQPA